jgi:predicted phage terminase large subunit-like protein
VTTTAPEVSQLPEAVQRELAERELARRHFLDYVLRMRPTGYQAGWVHRLVCEKLEQFLQDVIDLKGPRLMLFMPPRVGKSTLASEEFPSWVLGKYPHLEIISTSYSAALPVRFSRRIRERVRDSAAFKALFPESTLHPESQGVEEWNTTAGGGYRAAGVGGGITGSGAHVFIIDDPVKDAQEADSETMLEGAWDWFNSTAYTRLAPGGGVLIIMTRWSDLDLAGRLIAKQKEDEKDLAEGNLGEDEFDRWEVVSFPAIAKEDEEHRAKGEALHPERFPLSRLQRIRRALPPRYWNALYQQDPVPDDGAYFSRDQFRMETRIELSNEYLILGAWDLAMGTRQTNDWTVGVTGALDHMGYLHFVDMLRGRWGDPLQIADLLLDSFAKHRHHMIGIEKGQLELALAPTLKRRMLERKLYPVLAEGDNALKPITDKMTRARPLQGLMQQGMCRFPKDEPWVETLQMELLRFPNGAHDDIVDAGAWLARMAERIGAPSAPKKVKLVGWRDKMRLHSRGERGSTHMEA